MCMLPIRGLMHRGNVLNFVSAAIGSAFHPLLVHQPAVYAPRFLPTLGHPHAVALRFIRCDQLAVGLAPTGARLAGRTK